MRSPAKFADLHVPFALIFAKRAKRRYEAHFISKLTDCDGENSETDSSIDFARACTYITIEQHKELSNLCQQVGKMLGGMIKTPGPFLISDF